MQSSLIRTKESITCGITNIPLTKPSKVYFMVEESDVNKVYDMFESLDIHFFREDNNYNKKVYFNSMVELDTRIMKLIWRNYKSLHPKFASSWRYLFWEIDDTDNDTLTSVLEVYKYLKLPVYVHRSMRGYHFLSVKPIEESLWKFATDRLRNTNEKYPPITLRINPNKYIDEDKIFYEGFVMGNEHSDTKQLRNWIISKDFNKIGEKYQLVYYHIDKIQEDIDYV